MIDTASFIMAGGQMIASERIQGVNDNMAKSHYHEYFEIYYLEYGKRYHMVDDNIYSLNSGEFIIFPPYSMHHSYGDNDVPFKRVLVYFSPETVIVPEVLHTISQSAGVYRFDTKASQSVHLLLNDILKEQGDGEGFHSDAMKMLLNLLLIKIARRADEKAAPENRSRITEILHYLHSHSSENITLEDLASRFYLSPYYLCREFKRYTNSTIIQYINHIRIIHAQRLFMETNRTITDISKEVGFSNVTHFNRVFKSIIGMSPSKNRKQYADQKKTGQ